MYSTNPDFQYNTGDEEEEETETTTHNDSENHIDDKAFDHEEELVFDEDLSNSDDFLVVDDKDL